MINQNFKSGLWKPLTAEAVHSRYSSTFDFTCVGHFILDERGLICEVNAGGATLLGLERNRLIKQPFEWFVAPEDSKRFAEFRASLSEDNDRKICELKLLGHLLGLRHVRIEAGVDDLLGVGRTTKLAVIDITEYKRAEEELQQLRQQLWRVDRVVKTGMITASLGHELNQPLAAILANAQSGLRSMDAENPDSAEIPEILMDIVEDVKRAEAIFSGLRAILSNGQTEHKNVDLVKAIEQALELLQRELRNRQIQLRLSLEPDFPVWADKVQVQQVIVNLVMNAVEAMQDQPAELRQLDLSLTHNIDGKALVAVRDSGPGISKDKAEKMFEPFWTSKPQGMGIGLHISRSIIESHGGRLWFANNPEPGATFYFTLPGKPDPEFTCK